MQSWIHRRCKQAGLPTPAAVHLISSVKGTGVKGLLSSIQEMVGSRGDVWVVGAQNAGKSSLINAMQRLSGLKGSQQQLTTAAHPGTTLGEMPHLSWLASTAQISNYALSKLDYLISQWHGNFESPEIQHLCCSNCSIHALGNAHCCSPAQHTKAAAALHNGVSHWKCFCALVA